MTIQYKATVTLLLLVAVLANERFKTTLRAKDDLLFSEHVYREMGVKVLISVDSLAPGDAYRISITQIDVDKYQRDNKK